jgi:hypothetical protein
MACDAKFCEQLLVHDSDIAHGTHPLRALRFSVAGMMWNDHIKILGKFVVKRNLVQAANIMMQHQKRRTAAAPLHVDLYARNIYGFLAPANNRSLFSCFVGFLQTILR